MTFVIVGAGSTGVELAGSIVELVYQALSKDYPDLPVIESRLVLVEALDQVLSTFEESLRHYTHRRLAQLGVEIRLHTKIVEAGPQRVVLGDGSEINCHTLIWTAGVRAAPLIDTLSVPKGPRGRVRVTPELTIPEYAEVFCIGDIAHFEQDGEALGMVAPVAIQQGAYVARTLLRLQAGQSTPAFRFHGRGNMAIIGRYAAVADAYGVRVGGFVAWGIWLALHLYYLISFRNRLMALLNWTYSYALFDPKLRIITEE
jgi:NADH dehydrogenase